mmetsp:Transcript_15903/g.38501  ORF Transcript_15903/g.38501 Transcript_15903/m.38501 type:complete len:514 (-) Transcript_15903:365-1906(-)
MSNVNVYRGFTFIAIGGALFGYVIGITGNVVTTGALVCDPNKMDGMQVGGFWDIGYDLCYELSDLAKGWVSSLNIIAATLSSLICFRYADKLGRKREALVGAVLYFIGATLAALGPNLFLILLGLSIYGLGIGFAMHAAPTYIAEISPPSIRGSLVSAKEAIIVCGICAGFGVGAALAGAGLSWRWIMSVGSVLAVVMFLGILTIPRSPRWLVLRAAQEGRDDTTLVGTQVDRYVKEARESLQFFRRGVSEQQVESELQSLLHDARSSVGTAPTQWSDAFNYPKPLIIGCGLVTLQQVTGQPSVLYFATNIFKDAGFSNTAALASFGVGFVKLIATLTTVWQIDKFGRRPLLIIGTSVMLAALVAVGVAFLNRECAKPVPIDQCEQNDVSLPFGWAIVSVVALAMYTAGYQIGFGPISWLMISEVFPLNVRGAALSIAAVVNFSMNVAVTTVQPTLLSAITPSGVFFTYAVLCVVSILFVVGIVPETKGKTLEEIETMLVGRRGGKMEAEMHA